MPETPDARNSRRLAIFAALVVGAAFFISPFGLPLLLPFLWLGGVILGGVLLFGLLGLIQGAAGPLLLTAFEAVQTCLGRRGNGIDPVEPRALNDSAGRSESPAD